ncbi:MAG: hypothetical protein JXM79_21085 [Sedimentisphaerales bacterium]|nr:hypothetical protein [Sedimentisphaerales bacterium]
MLRKTLLTLLSLICLNGSATMGADKKYNVLDFGARPDGKTLCTQAIQKTVDQCAKDGGGTVYFPAGTWLTGTIYLESHVTLWLDSGCVLLGSKEKKDYGRSRELSSVEGETFSYWGIIAGKNLKNIAIRGRGTIDGQGSNFKYKNGSRPKNIYLENCTDVLIEGIRLRNAGSWMQHYRKCERLTIRNIAVFNHVSYNNDGLNIDSCRDVTINGCVVDSDDDGIVLKSLSLTPCENITISDCVVSSHCNSIKMGTESGGGFQNITIANCAICSPRYSKVIYGRQRGLAGLALEIVDGGTLDRVTVSNLTIKGVTVPIFMRLGDRARLYEKDQSKPDVGTFRNVIVSNIVATECSSVGCSITGLPGHMIENVTLSNIHLAFEGSGTREEASRRIAEKPDSYPESTMFGTLPAYGFFCRHVKDLKLQNLRLETTDPDRRHAIVFDDVNEAVLDDLEAPFAAEAAGMIRCTNSQNVCIRHCRPPNGTELFFDLQGPQTKNILLLCNDLGLTGQIAYMNPDVPESALILQANHTGDAETATSTDETPPPVPSGAFIIDSVFPGGNSIVNRIEGDTVYLRPDLRDTSTWWFYWYFRVRGAAGRTLAFQFEGQNPIGTQGPAVSTDAGATWSWLGPKAVQKSSFKYTFDAQHKEVRFCFSIPYLEANLHEFLSRYTDNPYLAVRQLCHTRKGRTVERLHVGKLKSAPKYRILLTARHHACEMIASYSLEGLLEAVLADTDLGRWFRDNVEIMAIPFVDKDGVEDGDQGKNRKPHDHNRDYAGDSIYPSIRAIRQFVPQWSRGQLDVVLDLHCPYIRGTNNEEIYLVGSSNPVIWKQQQNFAAILETVKTGPLPYSSKNNIPFGTAWNTTKNYGKHKTCSRWGAEQSGVRLVSTIEIPYANMGKSIVSVDNASAFGRDLALALRHYLESKP